MDSLILIVDKDNFLGEAIGNFLSRSASVVLVSKQQPMRDAGIIFIPYTQDIPKIPDGMYQRMLLVWSGEQEHLLEPLCKKAQETGADFFLLVKDQERQRVEDMQKNLPIQTKLLVLGDMVGGTDNYPLDEFLIQAKKTKRISLPGMGLHLWWPVVYKDAVQEIATVIVSPAKAKTSFFIGPKHSLTALTLAHGIQKVDPEVLVDFSSEKFSQEDDVNRKEALVDYDSLTKVQKVYKDIVIKREKSVEDVGSFVLSKKSTKRNPKLGFFSYLLYLLLVVILLPFLLSLASGGLGAFFLTSGIQDMEKGLTKDALQKVVAARQCISFLQNSLDIMGKEMSFVGQGSVAPLQAKAKLAYSASQILENSIVLSQHLANVFLGKTPSPKEDIGIAVGLAKRIALSLQEIPLEEIPSSYQKTFSSLKELSALGSGVVDKLGDVVGIGGQKTYLVLFQNNMELRPGGGFIGSYGLLTINNGAVKTFTIHDVYDADGQLQGHVEPPFAIRRYIPLVHLYLRDSNFDPDFSKNAKTAAFLLSEETGEKVDGVVGVDLDALRTLLGSVGVVYVPSYNETVTDKNFFQRIEEHAEKNFFPGSTQKKDFLRAVFVSLTEKVQKQKSFNASFALNNIANLFLGKHIMVAFPNPLVQAPFSLSNFSGSLPQQKVGVPGELNDFIGISEANLGVNKVNAFVTRKLSQQVTIDDTGSVQETTVLSLTNTSDGTWPGGVYRSYVRFILPENAVIKNILLNNVEQHIIPAITDSKVYEAKSFIAPQGLEVAKESESGKALYGFLVTVAEKSQLTITISYAIENIFSGQLKNTYNLVVWKQPGVPEFPYNLSVTIPQSRTFLGTAETLSKGQKDIQYVATIDSDKSFSLSFSPQ